MSEINLRLSSFDHPRIPGLLSRWRQWYRCRATMMELSRVDDRILKDIGLHRSQIPSVSHELARMSAAPYIEASRSRKHRW